MQMTLPESDKKQYLYTLLLETFNNRRDWIHAEHPTIGDIQQKYPRLLDYNGSMVSFT